MLLGSQGRLTIMVSSIILSQYSTGGAPGPGASRSILGGPLYSRAEVLDLLSNGVEIRPVTQDCIDNVQDLKLSPADLLGLLTDAVLRGRYLNAQWCETGKPGVWAACDAYRVSRKEWNDYAHKELEVTYYVKFCIGKQGGLVLLISCHTSDR